MSHQLIVGMTQSGKSLLAKSFSRASLHAGVNAIVFDPMAPRCGRNVNGWTGHVYNDFDRFEAVFWRSRSCYAVIDEAGDVFRDYRGRAMPMLTRGRHVINGGGGHVVAIIAQRVKLVPPTARSQCTRIWCFTINREDSAELALDRNADELAQAFNLPQFHYIAHELHRPARRGVVRLSGAF